VNKKLEKAYRCVNQRAETHQDIVCSQVDERAGTLLSNSSKNTSRRTDKTIGDLQAQIVHEHFISEQ
jgi:hypothetical protein